MSSDTSLISLRWLRAETQTVKVWRFILKRSFCGRPGPSIFGDTKHPSRLSGRLAEPLAASILDLHFYNQTTLLDVFSPSAALQDMRPRSIRGQSLQVRRGGCANSALVTSRIRSPLVVSRGGIHLFVVERHCKGATSSNSAWHGICCETARAGAQSRRSCPPHNPSRGFIHEGCPGLCLIYDSFQSPLWSRSTAVDCR
jgi:hypothetical protein